MKRIFLLSTLLCLNLSLLAGCGNKAPGCSDEETKNLVIQIARGELIKVFGKENADKLKLTLEFIRTKEVNKDTGSCDCAADLVITGPDGSKSEKIPITYTSELTDKKDQFYVTVYGL